MKMVFRLRQDRDKYQYFLPEDPTDDEKLKSLCKPMKDTWQPPGVFIYEPFLEKGDFYQPLDSFLILSPRALSVLKDYFVDFGEVLPLPYKGEIYGFVNILKCYECLDHSQTEWMPGLEGFIPTKYIFNPQRLPFHGPFKIPQTYAGEILVYVETHVPEQDDLRYILEKHNLKGAIFEELWRDE